MNTVIFLIMRKMRVPLLVLLTVYTIAVVGMTLVPGQADGHPWRMDFFHAFYFVSYMGTTIGFGELPHEFTDAQRLWATFSLYLTVIAWFYAIGTLLALVQDDALREVIKERKFASTVRTLRQPFYLICGYGDTGYALVSALEERLLVPVVIEIKTERINVLTIENYPMYVPRLCADASKPEQLLEGGLNNPYCQAVVAITNDNYANLNIAITAKLLNPDLKVICRVDSHEIAANMASFGTNYIIDPFDIFAARLHTALYAPHLHQLRECLKGRQDMESCRPLNPPTRGLWVLCGYGRFGKAIYEKLKQTGKFEIIIVEEFPKKMDCPEEEYVTGRGTRAMTLRQANIESAVGIIAGTDDDVDNLSIVMTARELNPNLFVIIRQNYASNRTVFKAVKADIVMQASQIISDYIRILLTTPLLVDFIRLSKEHGDKWAYYIVKILRDNVLTDNTPPHIWEMSINEKDAPTVCERLRQGKTVKFEHLICDPRERTQNLPCLTLLLVRGEQYILLPEEVGFLEMNDRLLWCGTESAISWMEWTLRDPFVLTYIITGQVMAKSYVWRWFQRQFDSQTEEMTEDEKQPTLLKSQISAKLPLQ